MLQAWLYMLILLLWWIRVIYIFKVKAGCITGWITVKSKKTFHDGTRREMIHAGGKLFGASAIEKMIKIIQGLAGA